MANTHKAVGTIHTAPVAKDEKEIDRRVKAGVPEQKTIKPGEHFNPSDVGMSPEEVKKLEERRAIAPLEGGDRSAQPVAQSAPNPAGGFSNTKSSDNRGPGSGATGLGTSQTTPPGVDQTGKT